MDAPARDLDKPPLASIAGERSLSAMNRCKRCGMSYLASKSSSALRLTYCSFLCELGDLGFSMQGLEHMERAVPQETPAATPVLEEPVPAIAAAE